MTMIKTAQGKDSKEKVGHYSNKNIALIADQKWTLTIKHLINTKIPKLCREPTSIGHNLNN